MKEKETQHAASHSGKPPHQGLQLSLRDCEGQPNHTAYTSAKTANAEWYGGGGTTFKRLLRFEGAVEGTESSPKEPTRLLLPRVTVIKACRHRRRRPTTQRR